LENKALSERQKETLREQYKSLADKISGNNPYTSSHWEEPNVLAHIRFNERTGPNGERILFIEEVQSDFGQAHRKQLQNIENAVTNDFKAIVRNMEKTGILKEIC